MHGRAIGSPNEESMIIRAYDDDDLEAVARIYTDAVHELATGHYDEAQREAWAPTEPDSSFWRERMAKVVTLVAEADGDRLGFVSFERTGYVDLLFVDPRHARRGVATRLYAAAEEALLDGGALELTTHASLVARPFFERQGFVVEHAEDVERHGAILRRFAMRKSLSA
jgi:putative acetyltransferase